MARHWSLSSIIAGWLVSSLALAQVSSPFHYKTCGQDARVKAVPERAVSMDINATEIMLSLGLASRMVAIAGVADGKEILPELRADFDRIPKIDASYPSLDAVVGKRPDFVFAGWQYGFSESTGLTPKRLEKFGIASYALAESCIRIGPREKVSLDDVFEDIRTIGRVFNREQRAETLVDGYKKTMAGFFNRAPAGYRPRIFLYDSGEASPYTAGRFATPQAMMEAAGGLNIFDDLQSSWAGVSWEAVLARKPEFVIIVDYGDRTADEKIRFLEKKFRKASLDVMARKRFIVLPYAAVTPGIRTMDATAQLAQAMAKHFSGPGIGI